MKKCIFEGCENKYKARWYCDKHYLRLIRHWTVENRWWCWDIGEEKFWLWINKDWLSETPVWTPCWLWKWWTNWDWYWVVSINRKYHSTHRYSWELHNKKEIPKWLLVCHKCDTRLCVNPEHLFLGTSKDNSDDKIKKWRYRKADQQWEKWPWAKLTNAMVLDIRNDNRSNNVLAKIYNVSARNIRKIKDRWSWKHI